ncbi:MAG TPA: dihydroneopterin aldolase family protein [Thermoplasmata archaeon]|nr:dihydroneopterin aldolase family protein [Thermoplasmata archaeon]
MTDRRVHRAALTPRESLLFEAGIKLGGVFHQYLGVPISRRTAPALARAIEDAVRLQPYVSDVRVRIDVTRGSPVGRGRFAYRYLVAEMLDVTVRLRHAGVEVESRLAHRADLNYVLMSVERVGRSRPKARSSQR